MIDPIRYQDGKRFLVHSYAQQLENHQSGVHSFIKKRASRQVKPFRGLLTWN